MSLVISVAALVVACLALYVTVSSRTTEHFHAYSQFRRVVGHDGKERDCWSFNAAHSETFIGRTFGKIYIAMAHAKHARMVRKLEAAQESTT
ncbi:hypothetical protein [Comamonas testosteroni]|uniref:hypothetical protein n=1 Tax=Comamonas testosteroni TaxID=285 RepID=UPI0012D2B576|nr:hypothetical protein [Comamonas testosteroni]